MKPEMGITIYNILSFVWAISVQFNDILRYINNNND